GDPREAIPVERVKAEREIVRECYRRLLAGEPVNRLVRELNARGVFSAKGARWSAVTLSGTLQRAALAGLVEYKGQIIGEAVNVEAVVSREERERLRGLFAARQRGPPVVRHEVGREVRSARSGVLAFRP